MLTQAMSFVDFNVSKLFITSFIAQKPNYDLAGFFFGHVLFSKKICSKKCFLLLQTKIISKKLSSMLRTE